MEMKGLNEHEVVNLEAHRGAQLEKIRKKLKSLDELNDFEMSDDFFDKLHDKIMDKVDETKIAPPPVLMKQRRMLRTHWRGWLYPVGGLMSVLMVSTVLMGYMGKINESMQRVGLLSDGRERIVAEALEARDDLSKNLISMQSEADFFVDVASESFETLPVANFKKMKGGSVR